jgi:hypothetical protein
VTPAPPEHVLELTTAEYLAAWSRLELGLVHWNLQVPGGPERTAQDWLDEQRRTWERLKRRGLVSSGELAPDLADSLRLIAELGKNGLRLRRTRSSALPAAVAEIIGERRPGSGSAVSVPARLLPDHRGLPGVVVERALVSGGVRTEDARSFRTMLRGPKLGGGKFGAARYDLRGTRRTAEFVVSYFDTERGGYTIEQKRGPDRSPWYTLAPAHRPQLERRLAELLDSIRM